MHAIGLRQPRHAQRGLVRCGGAHVGARMQGRHHGVLARAGREPHVDARQPSDTVEVRLRARDIDHEKGRPVGRDAATDIEGLPAPVGSTSVT